MNCAILAIMLGASLGWLSQHYYAKWQDTYEELEASWEWIDEIIEELQDD